MSASNGGPAFPQGARDAKDGFATSWVADQCGMSLRDYFAAQALAGYCSRDFSAWDEPPDSSDMAKWAYHKADAMLKAREEQS